MVWLFLGAPTAHKGLSPGADEQGATALPNTSGLQSGPAPVADPPSQLPPAPEAASEPPETGNAVSPATPMPPQPANLRKESDPVAATDAVLPATPATVAPDQSQPYSSLSGGSWWPWLGWLLSLLLVVYLIRAQAGWRTAFENKEWLLLPSDRAADMTDVLQRLVHNTHGLASSLSGSAQTHSKGVESLSQAIQDTRAEFTILREELDRKTREIADLKLGHEFHARRPVLRAVAHAMQIIDEATHSGEPSESTLAGVATELRECLEDNRVIARTFERGTKLADAKGVSTQESIREPAADHSLRGTIGETLRCAYIVIGPSGTEDIVRPARVKIYT